MLALFFIGITPTFAQDTDNDGIADTIDLDDDNDGIPDIDEGIQCTQTNYVWAQWHAGNGFNGKITVHEQEIGLTVTNTQPFASMPSNYYLFSGYADLMPEDIVPRTTWGAGAVSTTCFDDTVAMPTLWVGSLAVSYTHLRAHET